jgi:hypothetical protein
MKYTVVVSKLRCGFSVCVACSTVVYSSRGLCFFVTWSGSFPFYIPEKIHHCISFLTGLSKLAFSGNSLRRGQLTLALVVGMILVSFFLYHFCSLQLVLIVSWSKLPLNITTSYFIDGMTISQYGLIVSILLIDVDTACEPAVGGTGC